MKLGTVLPYLKKIQKVDESRVFFQPKTATSFISRNRDTECILIHNY